MHDTPEEAKAQHALDRARQPMTEGGLPFSDGAAGDTRFNGRHN